MGSRGRRWVPAAVRGGGRGRGRRSERTVGDVSSLRRPVRLRYAAGVC